MTLLDWPTYEYDTARPLMTDQPLHARRVYTRPSTPMQPWRPPSRRGRRETVLDALYTAWLLLVACGVAFLILAALALGLRDLFHLALGGHP